MNKQGEKQDVENKLRYYVHSPDEFEVIDMNSVWNNDCWWVQVETRMSMKV
jgi:hypothetical protein